MADSTMKLELCSAEHAPVELAVVEVRLPGAAGMFTVLPGHTPLLTSLIEGVVVAQPPEGDPAWYAVHGGFCEIANDRILVLADVMERRANIDGERAREALKRAEERLVKPDSTIDIDRAQTALARAQARIETHASGE